MTWLAFSFYDGDIGPILWADMQDKWVRFGVLMKPWTHVWKHICADVDTVSGNISVSMMGQKALTQHSDTLKTNKPKHLTEKIVIGIDNSKSWEGLPIQFIGSVSNINIHSWNNSSMVEKLSVGTSVNGNILDWTNALFEIKGTGVSVEDNQIENHNQIHRVVLSLKVDWHEGNRYCKLLGKGKMAEISNKEELKASGKKIKALFLCVL